jgi:putative glycerol-1-phosphate prenyltransferase
MKGIESHIHRMQLEQHKGLALLIDPDKCGDQVALLQLLKAASECAVDLLFVGGSLLSTDRFEDTLRIIKSNSNLPVVLFPGSAQQVSAHADALLLLSLISGRNADLLIGQHVQAAPRIRASGLEVLPTGYLLIDCGNATTASYISQTMPIPHHKAEIASTTVMAGEMLGLRLFYLDGGSGALQPVHSEMIQSVRKITSLPLIVGGGIRNYDQAHTAYKAGADIIVVGTAVEDNLDILFDLSKAKKDAIFTT